MTEQALKDAKLAALEKVNAELNLTLKSLSGQVKARQLQAQEQFDQNAQFRSSILLLELDLNNLTLEKNSLLERIKLLEKEKEEHQAKHDAKEEY